MFPSNALRLACIIGLLAAGIGIFEWRAMRLQSPEGERQEQSAPQHSPAPVALTPSDQQQGSRGIAEPEDETPKAGPRARLRAALATFDEHPDVTAATAALEALLALPRRAQIYQQDAIIRQIATAFPDLALRWIDDAVSDPEVRSQLRISALAGFAESEPLAALSAIEALDDARTQFAARRLALEVWAAKDVRAAYAWVASGGRSPELFVPVLQAYIRQMPDQAASLIAALPESPAARQLVDQYADELASTDPIAALDWLEQLDAPGAEQARATVIDQWSREDPWSALDYAVTEVDGEASYELADQIAAALAASDPAALAASLDRVPEAYRPAVAERLARSWHQHAPDRTRQWLASLPAGTLRDAALHGVDDRR